MSLSPVTDIKKWCELYDIELTPLECPKCKKDFEPNTTVAFEGYRGVTISDHGCGDSMPFRVVPTSKEKIAFWEKLRPDI